MGQRPTGKRIQVTTAGEPFAAFVPYPLPPDPPLAFTATHFDLLEQSNRALGRLDGLSRLLPDTSLFIYLFVRKEALLSSQIEGTQSSLTDLLLYEQNEVPNVPLADVEEVSSYVAALQHGLKRLREGFPLSLRLLREIHAVLLATGRGSAKAPGEFRRSQNWIGGSRPGQARFVPPPPDQLPDCLGALEKFLHDDPVRTPTLVKAALAHVQFETIHPFLDGNGRLGRLLITLLLCAEGAITDPTLYLSLYFKQHREQYYDHLQRVREEGAWEQWLAFFLTGVLETADSAVASATAMFELFAADRQRIESIGRAAGSVLRVHQHLQKKPITSAPVAAAALGLTTPTVRTALDHLAKLQIVREITGKRRDRLYVYNSYLHLLQAGVEPLGEN
ncbi:MAG TPA: Fic family protein [Blastocatellia bacterium]|nr:Fic family protein [Blastocatellia bacterium]HMV86723.1 Fic family protein [Blastocatellia bacterium]HMY73317.1 Fic family protein [Blastocatellia bacterium]HMZ21494.1 Fic family protein [Blastocatellia bacterium]HNG32197.1 Fic family protein [Blastocatellia bacterium]